MLKSLAVTLHVTSMTKGRVKIYKIGKYQGVIRRVNDCLLGSINNLIKTTCRIMLGYASMCKDVCDFTHSIDIATAFYDFIEERFLGGRHCVIVTISCAREILCASTNEGTGDDAGNFIGLHQFKGKLAQFIQAFQTEGFFVSSNLQHAICGSVNNRLTSAHVLFA